MSPFLFILFLVIPLIKTSLNEGIWQSSPIVALWSTLRGWRCSGKKGYGGIVEHLALGGCALGLGGSASAGGGASQW